MKRSIGLNAAFDIMRTGKRYRLVNLTTDTYNYRHLQYMSQAGLLDTLVIA